MGKKSPLKSTSKKKNATTKPDSAKEITPAGETSAVKAASTKKAKGAKKQAVEKAAPAEAQPKEIKKAEAKKEMPLSIKELVLQKYDTPKPDTLFAVKADDSARNNMMSPPFVSGLDAAETERVRKLLFKTFDLSVPDPAPAEPEPVAAAVAEKAPEPEIKAAEPVIEKAPEPPVAPVSIAELLKRKFDIVAPATLYAPPVTATAPLIESPPFVSGLDAAETERVRKLLFKTFDLSVPDPTPAEPEPVAAAVEEKAPEPEVKAAEPVIEKAPEPPAAPVSIAELLKRKFDIVAPATLYTPPVTATALLIESPPFVSGLDTAETERVRKLLFKTFDLSVPDPAPAEPEPVIPAVEEKDPEPEVKAEMPEAAVEVAVVEPEVKAALPEAAVEVPVVESEVEAPVAEAVVPEPPTIPVTPLPNADHAAPQATPSEPEKRKRKFMEGLDPLVKKAIYAGCGLAAIFLLITIASFSNMSKYYLINRGDNVEVRKGRFAPLGTDRIALLTGARMLKDTKSAYTRAEVSPLIIENFISRADALMATKGMPNFEAIRPLLEDALSYAEEKAVRDGILQRLDRIDMTALVFKATISAGKENRSELESAREYLTKAAWLAKEEGEKEMIQHKLKVVTDKLSVPPPLKEAPPSKTPPAASSPAAHH
ncbi:MAG: hypothetical protein V2B19_08395 [Pseudomonadota bacterium]